MGKPKQINDVLKAVISNVQDNIVNDDMIVIDEWPELVGETVAQHTKAIRITNGTLLVATESSVWLYELRTRYYKRILSAIQKRVGHKKINKIRFTVGTL